MNTNAAGVSRLPAAFFTQKGEDYGELFCFPHAQHHGGARRLLLDVPHRRSGHAHFPQGLLVPFPRDVFRDSESSDMALIFYRVLGGVCLVLAIVSLSGGLY